MNRYLLFAGLVIVIIAGAILLIRERLFSSDLVATQPPEQSLLGRDLPMPVVGRASRIETPAEVTDPVVPVHECDYNVLSVFLQRREYLRQRYDAADAIVEGEQRAESMKEVNDFLHETIHVEKDVDEDAIAADGFDLRDFGFDPSKEQRLDWEFRQMMHCADRNGVASDLRRLVLTTFSEETRPFLKEHWLQLVGHYDACQQDVVDTVIVELGEDLDDQTAFPGGMQVYTLHVGRIADCPGLSPSQLSDLFDLYVHIIDATPNLRDKQRLIEWIAALFPYSPAMGRFALGLLGSNNHEIAWAGSEMIWHYLPDNMTPGDLETLFASEPGLLTRLLRGDAGTKVARAFITSLASKGGRWGVEQLIAEIEDPESTVSKAVLLTSLGRSSDIDWIYFAGFHDHADPEIREAASASMGRLAGNDDDAYLWLRQRSLSLKDEEAVFALKALLSAGREDTCAFLEQEVLPVATGLVKAQALTTYAFEAGADLTRVKAAATSTENNAIVRGNAALAWIMATRDEGEAIDLVTAMTDDPDPDIRKGARTALTIYYEALADPRAEEYRHPLFRAGYSAAELTGFNIAGLGDLASFINQASSVEHGDRVRLENEIETTPSPIHNPEDDFTEGVAWLNLWIHRVTAAWKEEKAANN